MDSNYIPTKSILNLHLEASKTATSNQLDLFVGVACAALKAQHHALEKRGERGDLVRKKARSRGELTAVTKIYTGPFISGTNSN